MFRHDPLLKVGVIVMALALALALVAVVVSVALRGAPEQAVASERVTTQESQVEPPIRDESRSLFESVVEKPRQLLTPEFSESEPDPDLSGSEPEQGSTPASEPGSRSQSEPARQSELARHFEEVPQARRGPTSDMQVQAGPDPAAQAQAGTGSELPAQARAGSRSELETQVRAGSRPELEPQAQPESREQSGTNQEQGNLPGEESDWPRPTQQEVEAANEPRHYNLPAGAIMGLTIYSIGIYNAPVFDSDSQWALANGIAHVPETSLPWSPTPQRNVYLAGHRMGYRGTWSRMIFYNLNKVGEGDKIVLEDRTGRRYAYRVSEIFLADPYDSWVMGQVRGRDMLTLQTCTPIPTFEKRLIVRADRV